MEEEKSMDFKKIMNVVFKNKIVFFSVFAIVMAVIILGITLVYNKGSQYYYSTFEYKDEKLNNGNYYDGSVFNINEISLSDALKKANSQTGINIRDIESMSMDKLFSVKRIEVTNETTKEKKISYELKIPKKIFSNSNQADAFIKALISIPTEKNIELVNNTKYDVNLISYDRAISFDEKVAMLLKQKNLISEKYNNIMETYGNLSLDDFKKISDYKLDFDNYFEAYPINLLYTTIELNGFIMDNATYKEILNTQKDSLKTEYALNKQLIASFTKERNDLITIAGDGKLSQAELDSFNSEIMRYTKENVLLKERFKVILKKLKKTSEDICEGETISVEGSTYTSEQLANFETQLSDVKTKLEEFTENLKNVETQIVKNCATYYLTNSYKEVGGGIGIITTIFIAVFLGFISAAMVNLIVYRKNLKEEK